MIKNRFYTYAMHNIHGRNLIAAGYNDTKEDFNVVISYFVDYVYDIFSLTHSVETALYLELQDLYNRKYHIFDIIPTVNRVLIACGRDPILVNMVTLNLFSFMYTYLSEYIYELSSEVMEP